MASRLLKQDASEKEVEAWASSVGTDAARNNVILERDGGILTIVCSDMLSGGEVVLSILHGGC